MPSTATVTAKVGPGLTATTVVLTNVTQLCLFPDTEVLQILTNGIWKEFDTTAVGTFTVTPSTTSSTYTITIS